MQTHTSHGWLRRLGVGLIIAVVVVSMPAGFISPTTAAGDTAVELTPETQTIDAGTTSTVAINLTDASEGVGAYEFTLNTSATDTVTVTEVELAGNPGQSEVDIAADGSGVTVSAFLADTVDTGTVSIATVTLQGETAGTTDLTLSNLEVGDENGNSYSITTTGDATVEVRESTTIQNTILSPETVDEQTTVGQSMSFDVLKMSSDGNTDFVTVTAPAAIEFADPTVTVTDAEGQSIAVESGPSLEDAAGGTSNQLTFGVAPDNTFNTSTVSVELSVSSTYPEVTANQSQDITLDLADSSGETATDTMGVTIQNTDTNDGSGTNQTVALSPLSQNVSVNDSVTVDITVSSVTNGVGAYEFSIGVNNSSRATITDITLGGNPGVTNVSIPDDGSSVTATAALADTADTGTVTMATVTVVGVNSGPVSLTPDIAEVGDESGNTYTIDETTGASITVQAGPGDITGDGNPAQDLDGDGLYEDVNGDGTAGVSDVQAFFASRDSAAIQSNTAAFDFNGDGSISISDVQSFFSRAT